jgi:hypothetical protein
MHANRSTGKCAILLFIKGRLNLKFLISTTRYFLPQKTITELFSTIGIDEYLPGMIFD